ncbi:uncharacterized protein G2W53_013988 [Senna tora]|uniref:Uncharacterized protein n=1 Tax=Senna tora TaxID=362788 RepID=A0A834U2X2_9FABA|nr:uncharacterized protein G2W53_013988 [Senna tora]
MLGASPYSFPYCNREIQPLISAFRFSGTWQGIMALHHRSCLFFLGFLSSSINNAKPFILAVLELLYGCWLVNKTCVFGLFYRCWLVFKSVQKPFILERGILLLAAMAEFSRGLFVPVSLAVVLPLVTEEPVVSSAAILPNTSLGVWCRTTDVLSIVNPIIRHTNQVNLMLLLLAFRLLLQQTQILRMSIPTVMEAYHMQPLIFNCVAPPSNLDLWN